jgi:hypothetical protein
VATVSSRRLLDEIFCEYTGGDKEWARRVQTDARLLWFPAAR